MSFVISLHLPLAILAVVISSLQSFRVAYAADVACGSIAVFGPAPLVVAQTTNALSVTRLNLDPSLTYRVHGNADDSCEDAYTVTLASQSTDIPSEVELTSFKGSEVYKVCASNLGYTTACSVPRVIPFFNPRQGAWKDALLGSSPVPVWSAPAAGVGTSFTLIIHGGTQSYTSLISAGYNFRLGISLYRLCSPLSVAFRSSEVTVTSSSLSVTVPAQTAGVYSICMAVDVDANEVADYFPLSAILGHGVHNLPIGVPNTDVAWELHPVSGQRLQYATLPMSYVRIITENRVVTDGWTYFGVDTSADICSPLLSPTFDSSQLLPFNATHVYVETTIPLPSGNPGGGRAVLCGARGETDPWQLLSTSHYWPWVYACPEGYGFVLPTDSTVCYSCPPNGVTPCNNNGNCGTFEPKTIVRSSAVCICYPRFYTSSCSNYDMYLPTVTPSSGTYRTKHLTVSVVKPPTADRALLQFLDGSTAVCSAAQCNFTFSASTKFRVRSAANNGSSSLNPLLFTYNIVRPTNTPTFTVTSSLTVSNPPSASLTVAVTASTTPKAVSLQQERSASESRTAAQTHTEDGFGQFTPTGRVNLSQTLPTDSGLKAATTEGRGTISAASLTVTASRSPPLDESSPDLPIQTSTVIELTSTTQYVSSLPDRDAFLGLYCAADSCTQGLQFSCDNLTVAAMFVAPESHYCTATFHARNRSASYTWEIRIVPLPVTRDNLLFLSTPRTAALYRYRAATVPYLTSSQIISLRGCTSATWYQDIVHLRAQQGCVVANVSASGFSNLATTIRDGIAQLTGFNSADSVRQSNADSLLAELLVKKSVSPGGVFLGVAFGLLLLLSIFSLK